MPIARILEYELYDVGLIEKSSFMSETLWRTNSRSIIHYLTDLKAIESPDRSPHPSFQSAIGVCPNLTFAIYGSVTTTLKANDLVESLTCRSFMNNNNIPQPPGPAIFFLPFWIRARADESKAQADARPTQDLPRCIQAAICNINSRTEPSHKGPVSFAEVKPSV